MSRLHTNPLNSKLPTNTAGGMSSPPIDPPPSSPTPLQGQKETNRTPKSEPDRDFAKDSAFAKDPTYEAAFEFGWQSYLQHGQSTASGPLPFEKAEPELARSWQSSQASKKESLPWEKAREAARDAWTRVQDAMVDGAAKPSAR